jgi:hypothetical protein
MTSTETSRRDRRDEAELRDEAERVAVAVAVDVRRRVHLAAVERRPGRLDDPVTVPGADSSHFEEPRGRAAVRPEQVERRPVDHHPRRVRLDARHEVCW